MNTLFRIMLFLICMESFHANSQMPAYKAVPLPEEIPWEQYTPSDKRFIMAGEAHHVSCIFPFQLSHLKFLVTKGFRYLIWEVPYSYSLIAQHYISTGNDTLLRYLARSREDLAYWKAVYEINRNLLQGNKLHLWGIDHELGDNVGGTGRAKDFKKALILLTESKGELPPSLQQAYLSLKSDTTIAGLTGIKHRLQAMQHDPEVVAFYGECLMDFRALVNRLDHYKVSRNDEMLEAFKEICSMYQLDSSAKFLGRFGWGHTDKSYKKSMAWLMENDPSSPVRNSTYVIGVQYLNCTSAVRVGGLVIDNDGIVTSRSEKEALATLNQQDPSPIKIFSWPAGEKPRGWAKAADVLFVFSGYPQITIMKMVKE
jgi:hypothetical protein